MQVLIIILWTILGIIGALVALFLVIWLIGYMLSPNWVPVSWKHGLVKLFFPVVCFLSGDDLVVHGKENLPRYHGKKGYAVISNHQGMFDILVLGSVFKDPIAFVAKKEIRRWPFVGIWTKTLGSAFIDRSNLRQSYEAVMVQGANNIKAGMAMSIFPAGTREAHNVGQNFKPGSFKMATSVGAPIVPVTLVNSFRAKQAHFFKRNKIHVYIHPMIAPEQYSEMSSYALAKKVEQTITETLEAYEAAEHV